MSAGRAAGEVIAVFSSSAGPAVDAVIVRRTSERVCNVMTSERWHRLRCYAESEHRGYRIIFAALSQRETSPDRVAIERRAVLMFYEFDYPSAGLARGRWNGNPVFGRRCWTVESSEPIG